MSNQALRPLDQEGLTLDELTMKVIHAGTQTNSDPNLGAGQAYICVREDLLSLVATGANVISVSNKYGITLAGPIAIGAMPDQISMGGGYWTINPLVLTGLPSTNATPIPWLVPSQPKIASGLQELTATVNMLMSIGG